MSAQMHPFLASLAASGPPLSPEMSGSAEPLELEDDSVWLPPDALLAAPPVAMAAVDEPAVPLSQTAASAPSEEKESRRQHAVAATNTSARDEPSAAEAPRVQRDAVPLIFVDLAPAAGAGGPQSRTADKENAITAPTNTFTRVHTPWQLLVSRPAPEVRACECPRRPERASALAEHAGDGGP
jgi:hypothetical protein